VSETRSVFGIFAYLTTTSMRNRFRSQAKQLRSPRYAFALILGIGYIWYFFFQPRRDRPNIFGSTDVHLVASVGVFILFMRWWLFGNDRSALAFTPAEIQFLFPAPVTRRALIQFKLLRGQIAIILNATLWVLLFGRGGTDLPPLLRVLSIWALLSVFMLHRLGATIVRAATAQHGKAGAKRNVIALVMFGIVAAGLLWTIGNGYAELRHATGVEQVKDTVLVLLREPIANALLAPFRVLLAPTFAHTIAEWAPKYAIVLGIVALHYVWVLRTELAFEDAAVEASAARARRIEALRARRAGNVRPVRARAGNRTWIPLGASGHPAFAILWKNVLALTRTSGSSVGMLMLSLSIAVAVMVVASQGNTGFRATIGFFALGMAAFSLAIGARFVRIDLRQDLMHLRLLRTYPIDGSALVAAEVAGSTVVLTAIQMGLLLAAHFLLASMRNLPVTMAERWLLLAAAPFLLLVFNAVTVTIQNAAALLFPAWVRLGTTKSGGIEVLGQSILSMVASLVVLALALIPPTIAARAAWFVSTKLFADAYIGSIIAAAVVGVIAMAAEVGMAMLMLGEVFERGEMVGVPVA
jgi:ABC-2 type transport system permease protein